MLRRFVTTGLCMAAVCSALATAVSAGAAGCARGDFEAVVDDAAAALRGLNSKNKPVFQERLRALKDKRGWNHDEFLAKASPFVRDDQIAVYDRQTQDLLAAIATLGQEGSEAKTPDCGLLDELRSRMKQLVEAQTQKWTYMFGKLDKAMAE